MNALRKRKRKEKVLKGFSSCSSVHDAIGTGRMAPQATIRREEKRWRMKLVKIIDKGE